MGFKCQLYFFLWTLRHKNRVPTDVRLNTKEFYLKFHRKRFELEMIHLDFEKAAHNAVLQVFENSQVGVV